MKQGYVKVAAAVPYVKVADCYYNVERISEMVHQADAQGVEIVTFPELSVTGYTCGDLFLQPFLLDEANAALCQLVRDTADTRTLVIVGMPVRVEEKLFNSAVVFQQGHILGAIPPVLVLVSMVHTLFSTYRQAMRMPVSTTICAPLSADCLPKGCVVTSMFRVDMERALPTSFIQARHSFLRSGRL